MIQHTFLPYRIWFSGAEVFVFLCSLYNTDHTLLSALKLDRFLTCCTAILMLLALTNFAPNAKSWAEVSRCCTKNPSYSLDFQNLIVYPETNQTDNIHLSGKASLQGYPQPYISRMLPLQWSGKRLPPVSPHRTHPAPIQAFPLPAK